jgi:CheY-like chemotaxis protein
LKIVMLTAKGRDTEVAKGLAIGADAYVTKPFSTKELAGQGQIHARRKLPKPIRNLLRSATVNGKNGRKKSKKLIWMNAMKAKHRFSLAVVIILGLLMTGPFVVTSLLVWLDMKEAERNSDADRIAAVAPAGRHDDDAVRLSPLACWFCTSCSNSMSKACCGWPKPAPDARRQPQFPRRPKARRKSSNWPVPPTTWRSSAMC